MTRRPPLRWNRITQMLLPTVIVLTIVMVFPLIATAIKNLIEASDSRYAEAKRLFEAQLEPCHLDTWLDARLAPSAGEVGIYILPSFEGAHAFKTTQQNLSRYTGDPHILEPSAPPPPGAASSVKIAEQNQLGDITFSPDRKISPALAKNLFDFFEAEIATSRGPKYSGFDGISYFFAYGDKCATTWTPESPNSRAGKIAELADDILLLSDTPVDRREVVTIRIVKRIEELESDRRRFDRQRD